jgi:hypothetical protein
VATLAEGPVEPGVHERTLDTSGLPSGVYLLRLSGEGFNHATRLLVVR